MDEAFAKAMKLVVEAAQNSLLLCVITSLLIPVILATVISI